MRDVGAGESDSSDSLMVQRAIRDADNRVAEASDDPASPLRGPAGNTASSSAPATEPCGVEELLDGVGGSIYLSPLSANPMAATGSRLELARPFMSRYLVCDVDGFGQRRDVGVRWQRCHSVCEAPSVRSG